MNTAKLRCALVGASVLLAAHAACGEEAPSAHYQRCLSQVQANAQAALEAARSWEADGGGAPAGHCEALALMGIGDPNAAAKRLEKLAGDYDDLDPGLRAGMLSQAGNAWLVALKPDLAVADFSAALDLANTQATSAVLSADLYSDRARAHLLEGDAAAAKSDLDHSIAMAPSAAALALRAHVERTASDYKDASADIASAFKLDPASPDAYLERGRLRADQGDAQGARDDFIKAAMLQKKGPVADEAHQEIEALDLKKTH